MDDGLARPDLVVVARLLEALALRGGPVRPTRLQQAAGTNYTQLERYLSYLASRGLVTAAQEPSGERWISLTPKGREAYRFLVEALVRILGDEDRRTH